MAGTRGGGRGPRVRDQSTPPVRPEDILGIVLRRANHHPRGLRYTVEAEISEDGGETTVQVIIARFMFKGDAFAYGKEVVRRVRIDQRRPIELRNLVPQNRDRVS
jgi:hypothetical protein